VTVVRKWTTPKIKTSSIYTSQSPRPYCHVNNGCTYYCTVITVHWAKLNNNVEQFVCQCI